MDKNRIILRKIASLELRYTTLYNRWYANYKRRSDMTKRRDMKIREITRKFEKINFNQWIRLARVIQMADRKRIIVSLSAKEYARLKYLLRGN